MPTSALLNVADSVPDIEVFASVTLFVLIGSAVVYLVIPEPAAGMFPPLLSVALAANRGLVPWLPSAKLSVLPLSGVGELGFALIVI